MVAAAVLVAALALGAPGLELRAGAAALGRTRVTVEGGDRLSSTAVEATPTAALDLRGLEVDVGAGYEPLLRVPEVTGSGTLEVLHRADLRLGARLARTWTSTAGVSGELGRTDLRTTAAASDAGADPGAGSAIPTLATVRIARAAASAALEGRLDPRTRLDLRLRATAGGGDGPAARALLRVQQTAVGAARLAWNATPRETLSATLEGGAGRTLDTGGSYRYGALGGALGHRFSPALEGLAGAGVAALRSSAPPVGRESAIVPTAEVGLAHALQRPLTIDSQVALRLAPHLDAIAGGADQRLEATGTSTWRVASTWRFAARGRIARTLTGTDALHAASELRVDWAPAGAAGIGVGLTGEWQRAAAGSGLPAFTEYGVFVAAGFEYAPRARRGAARGGASAAQGGRDGGAASARDGTRDGPDGARDGRAEAQGDQEPTAP